MAEALLAAYRNLTKALLNSPDGEELHILAAHQELLGTGLAQTMLEVADELLEQGDSDNAQRLMGIASQLLKGYGQNSKTLGIARSQSPTQPNQTSPPSRELLINTIQKNTSSDPPSTSQQ